ncbi:MAG: HD domain-containing protein [Clostridiales bacterium]|nr:HD domain-containing protein [Clostridiales bacterium]
MASSQLDRLAAAMLSYYAGDPARIQHFLKVHAFSRLIGQAEDMDKTALYTLEAAAYVHDIGIKPAEAQYGSSAGPYQEALGPAEAERMLGELGFEEPLIRRVCYLVGHHHTYTNIDGLDYQILVEADFLVNLFEDNASKAAVETAYTKIFRTETGKAFCREMFGL